MRSIFMMAIVAALAACDHEERPDVGQVAPLQEIPDDPHLARGYRVYRDGCMVCHDRGAGNAPLMTDVADWRKRVAVDYMLHVVDRRQ